MRRYRLKRKLGEGGFGWVWFALDQKWEPDREVAIKILRPELVKHPDWRALQSDGLAARLSSPHVVQIFDLAQADEIEVEIGVEVGATGRTSQPTASDRGLALEPRVVPLDEFDPALAQSLGIVMEYVRGLTLKERYTGSGPLSVPETLRVGRAVAHALDTAHRKRIVHRDINPRNIMVGYGDSIDEKLVKVVDWGLALGVPHWGDAAPYAEPGEHVPSHDAHAETEWSDDADHMRFAGTAEYMAPERFSGVIDRHADIWAFGCVLFECLTGQRAFRLRGPELLKKIAAADVDYGELPADTPPRVRMLIELCLQADPKQRLRDIGTAFPFLVDGAVTAIEVKPHRTADLLPPGIASEVARDDVVSAAREVVAHAPLVALSGPIGCGKSWLALKVARSILDLREPLGFNAGAALLDVRDVNDVKQFCERLAALLGEIDGREPPAPDAESLRQRLARIAHARFLLVFDNADGVMRGLPELIKKIAVPRLHVVVTARRSASHPGWTTFAVTPLPYPLEKGIESVNSLSGSEAVQLFVMRAKSALRTFGLDATNASAVAGICRRVGGLPRAIELVASHVKFWTPSELLDRLPGIMGPAVAGGIASGADTMARTAHWSVDALSGDARLLLERVSVFEGPWTLASVEAVCCDESLPTAALHDLLNELVDLGLVQPEPTSVRPRFRVLEFVRDHCRRQLAVPARAPELMALRRRHLERFTELVVEPPPIDAWGKRVPRSLERLDIDHEGCDCRAAIELGATDPALLESTVDMAIEMQDLWFHRARYTEGAALLKLLLASRGDRGDVRQVRLLAARAKLDWGADRPAAYDGYRRALELQRAIVAKSPPEELPAQRIRLAAVLHNVALTAQQQQLLAESRSALEESLTISHELGDRRGEANARLTFGLLAIIEGRFDDASADFDAAISELRAADDTVRMATISHYRGRIALCRGQCAEAFAHCRMSLASRRKWYEPDGIAESFRLAGEIAAAHGAPMVAAKLFGASQRRRDAVNNDIPPTEVPAYECAVEATRSSLGPATFDAAWDEGFGLSDDETAALLELPGVWPSTPERSLRGSARRSEHAHKPTG